MRILNGYEFYSRKKKLNDAIFDFCVVKEIFFEVHTLLIRIFYPDRVNKKCNVEKLSDKLINSDTEFLSYIS